MALREARRLFDIATRLQVYIECVKAQQSAEFYSITREVNEEFKKLLLRINYQTLDGLTKAELNRLCLSLRSSQGRVYSAYTTKLLDQLQDFMQACLTVNRVAYVSAYIGLQQQEDDNEVIMSDAKASEFIEEENANNNFAALFGLAAILKGNSALWPKIANTPIAANGAFVNQFIKAFSVSASLSLENLLRKGYANGWTINQTAAAATEQLGKIANQADAVIATSMQHVSSLASMGVVSALWSRYRWLSVIDSGTTDICLGRNGKVYRFGDGPTPPAHIRCRSIIIPYNPAHDNETFYSWIKRQSNLTQNAALGTKTAALLRSGKLTSKDIARLSNPTPITITEFKQSIVPIITGMPPL